MAPCYAQRQGTARRVTFHSTHTSPISFSLWAGVASGEGAVCIVDEPRNLMPPLCENGG